MFFDLVDLLILVLLFFSCWYLTSFLLLKQYQKLLFKKYILTANLKREKRLYLTKIKAIERFALFLERLKVENLITRINPVSESVFHYKLLINATIEQEFNYNAVQHIYISKTCYQTINNAKDLMMQQIERLSQTENITIKEFKEALLLQNSTPHQAIIFALDALKQALNN